VVGCFCSHTTKAQHYWAFWTFVTTTLRGPDTHATNRRCSLFWGTSQNLAPCICNQEREARYTRACVARLTFRMLLRPQLKRNQTMTCKGVKKDGTPCQSRIVRDNGYCHAHQAQATTDSSETGNLKKGDRVRLVRLPALVHLQDNSNAWTQERLDAYIQSYGGLDGIDLAGVDLSGVDLADIDLSRTTLARKVGQDENHVFYVAAVLKRANLLRASMKEANLIFVDFQEANLAATDLEGAYLGFANLEGAKLSMANLKGARFTLTNLRGADLDHAELQDAAFGFSDFQKANLSQTDLAGFDLRGLKLQGVKLHNAKLDRTLLEREQLGDAVGEESSGCIVITLQRESDVLVHLYCHRNPTGSGSVARFARVIRIDGRPRDGLRPRRLKLVPAPRRSCPSWQSSGYENGSPWADQSGWARCPPG
jgi:uncharacterized protein YjbI with pentapeptide repeats